MSPYSHPADQTNFSRVSSIRASRRGAVPLTNPKTLHQWKSYRIDECQPREPPVYTLPTFLVPELPEPMAPLPYRCSPNSTRVQSPSLYSSSALPQQPAVLYNQSYRAALADTAPTLPTVSPLSTLSSHPPRPATPYRRRSSSSSFSLTAGFVALLLFVLNVLLILLILLLLSRQGIL